MGIDEEARQHIFTVAQRLYDFVHRTEKHEMELWHQLSGTMDLPRVERLMAENQNEMEAVYNNFLQRLSDFVNQEIAQFGRRLTLLEGT